MPTPCPPVIRRTVLAFACAAFAAIAVAIGLPAPVAAADDAPYQAARLVTRWKAIANLAFEDAKASVSDRTAGQIDLFLSIGAVRAVRERADEGRLQRADAGVARFADALIIAGARQSDGSIRIGERAFVDARARVCPVDPFCDREAAARATPAAPATP